MKVLIVSDNFADGGLETQINTTVEELKNKVDFFFAFKNYNEKWKFSNVYQNFHFSPNSTVTDFLDDVNNLIEIINKNNIDIVHIHPFYSLFPAVFAAKICNIPVVYTYHGLASFNFTSNVNDTLLLYMLLDYEINKIFAVSMNGKKIIENIVTEDNKIIFLPNPINTIKFAPVKCNNNKSWALISRLDTDKIYEIKKLINILDKIDINELHIYGSGNAKETLEKFIIEKDLSNKIFFEGHSDNLSVDLSDRFNGIIGTGRVAMEAISMQLPVLLIGSNKIAGIIDTKMYNTIKYNNFVNTRLPDISIDILKNQIQEVYNNSYDISFYSQFKENFSSEIVSETYYNELNNISNSSLLNLKEIYSDLKNIDGETLFYSSDGIYNILVKYFSVFIRKPCQKNLVAMKNTSMYYNNKFIEQEKQISEVNAKISNIYNELSNLSENTMTYSNLKRKIKWKLKGNK